LLLLQHHPKEKGFHDTNFLSHAGGRLGWVGHTFHVTFPAPSYFSHISVHARVTMSSLQGCVLLVVACSTLACYIIWQLKGRKGILDQSKIFCLSWGTISWHFFALPPTSSLSLSLSLSATSLGYTQPIR
jgi:hypothetical protein